MSSEAPKSRAGRGLRVRCVPRRFRRCLIQQRLSRPHANECDWLRHHDRPIVSEADAGVTRTGEIGCLREVLAEMGAAAVAPEVGVGGDGAADQGEIFQIEPVHPAGVVVLGLAPDASSPTMR